MSSSAFLFEPLSRFFGVTTIIALCWASFALYWLISSFSQKSVAERTSFASRILQLLIMIIAFNFVIQSAQLYPLSIMLIPDSLAIAIVSIALCVPGLITCIWARRTLAGNWSSLPVIKEDHNLVQDGPYKFVRHPIYTGFLLMFLGTAVAIGRLGGFIGFAVCFVGFWMKLRQEEALMIKLFKGNYLSYKKRVKALIPYLF